MRLTRIKRLSNKLTKYRERTLLDNYKKETIIAQHSETHSGSVGWEPNSLPHRPVETPAFNGILGYVPQLARIVVRLSPSCARSADLRRYIDYELDRFAEENNCTVVYIRPEEVSEPSLSAEWLDGSRQHVDLNGKSPAEISETFELLSAQATAEEMIYRPKPSSTQMPSIQETKLMDAWDVDIDERYYRPEELIKIHERPLRSGHDRKNDPYGPHVLSDDKTDSYY